MLDSTLAQVGTRVMLADSLSGNLLYCADAMHGNGQLPACEPQSVAMPIL